MLERIKRILKHARLDERATLRAVPADMQQRLAQRVAASEQRHGGEVRIYVESSLPLSYLRRRAPLREIIRERSVAMFGKLRVWDTEQNNGVLIYLLLAERAFELVADRGVNALVKPQTWADIGARMGSAFHEDRFEEGLTQALEEVSALLVTHFPLTAGQPNPNELPDHPVVR